jgi:nucleotide-binding universal stress UspA family protein
MLDMNQKIIAAVDQSDHGEGVTAGAIWAAGRLAAPVEFLHVLDRHLERAESDDHSGALGMDAQETLLESLSQEDASRSKMAREQGRLFLNKLRSQAAAQGLADMDTRLRHGRLTETLLDLAPTAGLVVIGRQGESTGPAAAVSRTVGELIHALPVPVLLTLKTFTVPKHVLVAFDGRRATRDAVRAIATSPLLAGQSIHLLMAGRTGSALQRDQEKQLDWAHTLLAANGFSVTTERTPLEAAIAIAGYLRTQPVDLLVMGIGKRSAIRQWFRSSDTTEILRVSQVATLIVR